MLNFTLDHARARDAVHADFDARQLVAGLTTFGLDALAVASRTVTRGDYLKRPDLGRLLDDDSHHRLATLGKTPSDVALVIADGLLPVAVQARAVPLIGRLIPHLQGLTIGPAIVASGARVALGDAIGELIGARLIIVMIGERPGLTTPYSLGAYLTFSPRPGLSDADRNCVSNIHTGGLSDADAAYKIAWLARAALTRNVSGVALKDDSGIAALPSA